MHRSRWSRFLFLGRLVFAALATSAISLAAQAIPITNGDFENLTGMAITTPTVVTGVPNGWTFTPLGTNTDAPVVQFLNYTEPGSPAGGGVGWYLEGHTGGSLGTLSQLISGLTIGATYQLDFLWGNRDDAIHPLQDAYNIGVSIGGQTFTASGSGLEDLTAESLVFVATSTSDLLEIMFMDVGPAGTHTNGAFDNFVLSQVPEPVTALLLGCGLFCLGVRHH